MANIVSSTRQALITKDGCRPNLLPTENMKTTSMNGADAAAVNCHCFPNLPRCCKNILVMERTECEDKVHLVNMEPRSSDLHSSINLIVAGRLFGFALQIRDLRFLLILLCLVLTYRG